MEKIKPKVSVIITAYNIEIYIGRCLDSVLNQTLKDIEIIIINDGSTDKTQEIIDSYAKKHPNIILPFLKKNGGPSSARNFALQHAHGGFLAFVDGDDFLSADMYEKMYDKAVNTEAEIVVCPFSYYYEDTKKFADRFYNENDFGKSAQEHPKLLDYADTYVWNKLFKTDFWKANGFLFPENQYFEDVALIYNVLLCANKVELVNIPFYKYVKGRAEAITARTDESLFDVFKATDSILRFAEEKKLLDKNNPFLVSVCMKHIFARFPALQRCNSFKYKNKFLKKTFEYINSSFANWRHCPYMIPEKGSLTDRLEIFIQRHYFLLFLYLHAPKFLISFFKRTAGT